MVILVRATTRLWAPQALVLAAQPRPTSSFQNLLAKSALHTSAVAAAQQRSSGGVGGTAVRELRPYATVVPAAERLVVIGDVHGDIDAFRSCLQMADLVDAEDKWAGGETVVVQMGDIFDRGDDDLPIQEWVYKLAQEAGRANGALYSVMGNHEMLNAMGDHSMATRKAFVPFLALRPELDELVGGDWSALEGFPEWARCRLAAMRPGGPVARLMAAHAVSMKVGDNLFVHAGLLPEHIRGTAAGEAGGGDQGDSVAAAEEVMERLNADTCAWMLGKRSIPEEIWQPEGPLWTRVYSTPDSREIDAAARAQLEEVLRLTGTKRMVVGHTPQRAGINSAADGQVWRVDTGMTAMIGGRPEALEIRGEEMTILTEYKSIPGQKRAARQPTPVSKGDEFRRQ
ncbi:calcineurin-like phosphoesterase family protein [Ectocarpus siliculosus]|uniref:Calcineurin-like phosphoesterase family protein n=1 Tax=Ectocarpus siliculosus TaxID=2880 RepID=D7G8J4_ECTSI|nr:calcineurin-like phosphoesterase family protein [Ectocarpus siliculosus]|eukprot:CBJ28039.1 calcineurin-like phosphoesterase family protein [Ectocarpus siliculosus]